MRALHQFLLIMPLALMFTTPMASDLDKEKRWADQIVDALLDGEAEYLNDGTSDFLTIYTEAEDPSSRAIIVAHGTGVHPDWEQVVQPIRVEMTTRGWNTLSIQMPILVNEATYEDYVPLYPEVPARIKAAEDFLSAKGMDRIVIVAHSRGASMSAYTLSRNEHKSTAFVAIGMSATQEDKDINASAALSKISIPVLDIYGSDDLESVLESADDRKSAASGNSGYREVVVEGANHFFDDHAEVLVEHVDEWLNGL